MNNSAIIYRKKKSTNRLGSTVDYSRSISVPADKARPSTAQKKISEPSMPGALPCSPEIELVVLWTQVDNRVCVDFVFNGVNQCDLLVRFVPRITKEERLLSFFDNYRKV